MKIEKIIFENLASSEGEHIIDLTQEPFCSTNLFTISTERMLDAICLALYGHTLRGECCIGEHCQLKCLKEFSTIDSKGGYSEVIFSTINNRYKASWAFKQNKKEEYQTFHTLEKIFPRREKYRDLDTTAQVISATGFNFHEFTRFVILPQERISVFLRATNGEKPILFEKLTGTEVYSHLSHEISHQTQKAQREYECLLSHMNGIRINCLDETDKIKTEEERKLSLSRLKNIEHSIDRIKKQLKWFVDFEEAMNSHHELNKRQGEVRKLYMDVYDDEKQLRRRDQLLCIQPIFQEIKVLEANIKEYKQGIDILNKEIEIHKQDIRKITMQLDTSHNKSEESSRQLQHMQPLLNKGYILQGEINIATSELKKREESCNFLHKKQQEKQRIIVEKELEIARLRQSIVSHNRYLQALSVHQRMLENIDMIKEKLTRFYEYSIEQNSLRHRLNDLQKRQNEQSSGIERLRELCHDIESQLDTLKSERHIHLQSNHGLNGVELQEICAKHNHSLQLLQGAQIQWKRISNGYHYCEEKSAEVQRFRMQIEQDRNTIDRLNHQVETLALTCDRKNTAYTLSQSDNMVLLRQRLKEGTACPVCGATHHPYHTETEQELGKLISSLEKEYRDVLEDLKVHRKELNRLQQTQAENIGRLQVEEKFLKQVYEQLESDKADWLPYSHLDRSFANCSASVNRNARRLMIEQLLENTIQAAEESKKRLDIFNFHQNHINKLNEGIDALETKINNNRIRLNEESTNHRITCSNIEELQNTLVRLERLSGGLYDELLELITLPSWLSEWQDSPENFRMKLTRMADEWNSYNKKLASDKEIEFRLEEELKSIAFSIEETERVIRQSQGEQLSLSELLAAKWIDIQSLFGAKKTDEVAEMLQQTICHSKEEEEKCKKSYEEAHAILQTLQGKLNNLTSLRTKSENNLRLKRSDLDLWIAKFNNNHSAVQVFELERIFSDSRDWEILRNVIEERKKALSSVEIEFELAQQRVKNLQASDLRPSERDRENKLLLEEKLDKLERQHQILSEDLSMVQIRLEMHKKGVQQIEELKGQIEESKSLNDSWVTLCEFVNRTSFPKEAQYHVFKHWINCANTWLNDTFPRFTLRQRPNTLDIEVIDRYLLNKAYTVDSLSSSAFLIVCLSMSFGLSSLLSDNRSTDTVFFEYSTEHLDNQNMELIKNICNSLQQKEKRQIGIISDSLHNYHLPYPHFQ